MHGSNHVWVPRYPFKLAYDPSQHRAWVHWIENTDDARVGRPISYQELVVWLVVTHLDIIGGTPLLIALTAMGSLA